MARHDSTIVSGFLANLLTNAIFWGGMLLGISALWPDSNQWYALIAIGLGSLFGVFNTMGLRRGTPLRPYRIAKFLAWFVTALVWAMLAVTIKGPIPQKMIVGTSGIMALVAIIGFLLYLAMLARGRRYYP